MAATTEFDLVCIGSGPAGQRGAIQAAKLGKRAAVIEKQRTVGGMCIDVGTIPSKTFREAVLDLTCSATAARNTLQRPSSRPTAEQLLSRVAHVVQRETEIVDDQLRRNDVAVFRGSGTFKDPHTLVVSADDVQRTITAANILIAVGTVPAPPPGITNGLGEVVITSDAVPNLKKLPRAMTVVGAGVIGIEYASMFAALGIEVTIIDRKPRPLDFLDFEIIDELIHQMRKLKVTFRMGEAVQSLEVSEEEPKQAVILLESGKRIVSDLVLYSAGRMGATETLNLPAAGLSTDDRGRVKVDDMMRTSVPHVFAAGDVIGYPSLAATSSEQGRLAACHAFGLEARPMASHFPIGIYSIPEISMVGQTEQTLTEQKVPYETGTARYREIARGQILGDESGMLKLIFHRDTRRLLGVHAIGTQATELIHIGQAVLGLGGGLDYFMQTVFNYPTLAECYKVAALATANKLAR